MTTKAGRAHIEDLKAGTIVWLIEATDNENGDSIFSTFPARMVTKARRLPQEQPAEVMFPRWELTMDFRDPNGNLSRDTLVLSTDNNPYHASGKIVLDNIFINRRAAERYCARMVIDEDKTKVEHPVAAYFYCGILYYPFRKSGPSFRMKQFKRELRRLKKKNANLKKDEVMVGGVVCNVKRDKRKIAYLMKASANDLVHMYPHTIQPLDLPLTTPIYDPNAHANLTAACQEALEGLGGTKVVDSGEVSFGDTLPTTHCNHLYEHDPVTGEVKEVEKKEFTIVSEDGNKGVTVKVVDNPTVGEDGILISDEALKKFDFKTYEQRAIDFPTNVFDEQNKEQQ